MDELHIEDFYKDCAVILLRLYRSFPRKVSVYVGDLCGYEETDDIGQYSNRFQACFSAIVWLTEEGYIRHAGNIGQEAIELATLTQAAFSHLSGKPLPTSDAHTSYATLAAQLHHCVTQATSDELCEVTRCLLNNLSVHGRSKD
ncbi:hypothetical protein ACFOEK_09015 [Litoribrevibacter euphylliae]|uniref:Uncharacterized protein n=1 Tax=Litoribrevibacter euphylliae TaxID=1834034 RepID=A0ABV7HET5_9GAMM